MTKAFLFDMDGTIFDTEKVYKKCWHEVSQVMGYEIPDELIDMMRGSSQPTGKRIWDEYFSGAHDYWEARRIRQQIVDRELHENGVPVKPGARELTARLRELGIKNALATSTFRPVTDFYLSDSGMTDAFDVIITGDMIENGKPEPDIFIRAAEELGLEPSDCVVCEDSLNGIVAGRRSGARVFYIPDLNVISEEQLSEYTDRTFDSLLDVLSELENGMHE